MRWCAGKLVWVTTVYKMICFSLHELFISNFVSHRLIVRLHPRSLSHSITQAPSVHFPVLAIFSWTVPMSFIHVLGWLERWHHSHCHMVHAIRHLQDCQRNERYHLKWGAYNTVIIFQNNWSDCFVTDKSSSFELTNPCSIWCASFGKDAQWWEFTLLFN